MSTLQSLTDEDVPTQAVETEAGVEYVVDLGPGTDASVDVAGDTAIVVLDDGDQHEFALPQDDAEAFITNGILTITTEVEA